MGAPSTQTNVGSTVDRHGTSSTTTTSTNDHHHHVHHHPSMATDENIPSTGSSTNNNSSSGSSHNVSDLVATYTSLIQQYLAVMCLDNATFLAERLVATSKTSDTLYLLALCYDRSGSPQRALSVLEDCKTLPTSSSSSSSSFSTAPPPVHTTNNNNNANANSHSAVQYLKAKCCYDLKQYGHAEDALLQPARTLYRQLRVASDAAGTDPPMPMDAWVLSTTPCPIPNGAAGLYLLGNICRRSNRKQRAFQYYHMALQLDPLLWSSYEALCEMGCNEPFMDPTIIFGVRPSSLDVVGGMPSQQQQQTSSSSSLQQQPKPLAERGVLTPSAYFSHTPMGAKPHQPLDLGTPTSSVHVPKGSVLFRNETKSGKRGSAGMSEASHQQHIFDTPDLTPIPVNHSFLPHLTAGASGPGSTTRMSQQQIHHHHHESSLLFADFDNPSIVRRARQVASHLYYEPSPEASVATPSPLLRTAAPTRRYLRGLDKPPISNRLSFSSVIPDHSTPATDVTVRRTGHRVVQVAHLQPSQQQQQQQLHHQEPTVVAALHPHDGSSHARKPRALFPSSENRSANTEPEAMDHDDDDGKNEVEDKESKKVEDMDEGGPMNNQHNKGVSQILQLFCLLGAAHWRLCQFRCRQAVQLFHQLPEAQLNTGWVLHQIGRAYFEMVEYQNAHRAFERMQQVEPHRMKGLEVLSTVLWHLKKEVELAHLAQRAVDFDRLCPEAWCVVGNCFSLQKEHETALVYLGRSIQLDSSFTYSHTLSGYEYLANEDFDKAVACFRTAVRTDDRHYNAWYGLGAIYHKQEKYDLAEYHFHRAVSINPQSSVLRCNLGMAQHANGKPYAALDTLADALALDPRNPQARYQRATIYMSMDRPEEALVELERVRDAAPREASVHFALGRVLKRLGRPHQAMKCFLTALDLDPKDNQLIKSAMDKLDEPDVDEEVVAF